MSKTLVVTFSASGVTKHVGKQLAKLCGGDFFEIIPQDPYTDADLNWMNKNSRSTLEMNDPNARPKIAHYVPNMDEYDTIVLGYPIWWGGAPRIVDTFLESYDLSGKKIIPFCTSGGSGVGRSDEFLHKDAKDAHWEKGVRITHESNSDLNRWLKNVL